MNIIEIAREVRESMSARVVRQKSDGSVEARAWPWKVRGGVLLDGVTASMLLAVHSKLSPENQEKLVKLPLAKAVSICWKLVR